MLQLNYRITRSGRVSPLLLILLGMTGDSMAGLLLLMRWNWQLFLWHLPFALVWAVGVNMFAWEKKEPATISPTAWPFLNKWGLTALLLGMGTFPGFGSCMCSIAFLITRYGSSRTTNQDGTVPGPEPPASKLPVAPLAGVEHGVQPFVESLLEGDTDARRAVVAKISRNVHPDTTRLLRQLLSDSRAEIRSDASIALSRLDDEMSSALNVAFEAWSADPTDPQLACTLADHYYRYARSNVLDSASQRFYLILARDLLEQIIANQAQRDMQWWFKLAQIRQCLGELPEALQDALSALDMQPAASEVILLAMDLAFSTHSWDVLLSLLEKSISMGQQVDILPLDWWTAPLPAVCEVLAND